MTRHLWRLPRLQIIGHHADGATFARKFSSLPSHLQLRLQLLNLNGQTPKRMPHALDAADLAWQPKLYQNLAAAMSMRPVLALPNKYSKAQVTSYRPDVDATLRGAKLTATQVGFRALPSAQSIIMYSHKRQRVASRGPFHVRTYGSSSACLTSCCTSQKISTKAPSIFTSCKRYPR